MCRVLDSFVARLAQLGLGFELAPVAETGRAISIFVVEPISRKLAKLPEVPFA